MGGQCGGGHVVCRLVFKKSAKRRILIRLITLRMNGHSEPSGSYGLFCKKRGRKNKEIFTRFARSISSHGFASSPKKARRGGFEPPWLLNQRLSRPPPYQAGPSSHVVDVGGSMVYIKFFDSNFSPKHSRCTLVPRQSSS